MIYPRKLALLLLSVGSVAAGTAQEAPKDAAPVLTLAQAVDHALSAGDTIASVRASLAASDAANKIAQAKNAFTVSASVGYGASQSYNSPSQEVSTSPPMYYSTSNTTGSRVVVPAATVGTETTNGVLVQSPTGTVSAGTPMTNVTGGFSTGYESWPDGSVRNVGTASAKLTQTIWNGYPGGPTQASAEQASLSFTAAQLSAQANNSAAVFAVKQAYYTILSAQENIELLQATLDSVKKTAEITKARFDQQVATAVDVLTTQVAVQTADLNLQAGQQTLVTARQRLANLMGTDPSVDFQAAPEPDPTEPVNSLDEAVAFALKNRTEPRIAELNARSSGINETLASGALIPSVSVTAGVTDYLDLNRSTVVGQMGVTLGAPLWDAGAASSTLSQARNITLGYKTQLHQLQQSIPVDVASGWNTWQLDQKRYNVSIDNKKAFDQELEIVRIQYQSGAKALSDLLIAQTNATSADFGLLTAKITAQLDALQLQSLLGL
jgi:outer membrane protein TolC